VDSEAVPVAYGCFGGKQFGRSACGCTPACGSEVGVCDATLNLGLRPRLVYVGPLALSCAQDDRVWAGKGKCRSRFPEGMTEGKATAKAKTAVAANAGAFGLLSGLSCGRGLEGVSEG